MPSAASSVVGRELFIATLVPDARRLGSLMHRFAVHTEELDFAAGETLFRPGDAGDYFFFVVSGQVKLSRPGAAASTFGEREVIGAVDSMVGKPRAHLAVTTRPTRVLRLRATDWTDMLEDNFELTTQVIVNLASRVLALRRRPSPLGGFDDPPPPSSPRAVDLQVVDRILHLRAVPIFARASTQALAALAQLGNSTIGRPGEVMFGAWETKGKLVVVASGEVEVSWGGASRPARFGEGMLVAGAAALASPPLAEISAVSPCRTIVLPHEDYFDVMEEHFDLATSALAALSEERYALLDRGS